MMDIAVLYATRDGHTRRAAFFLAEKLMDEGAQISLYDLALTPPHAQDLEEADQIVMIVPIRYGRHLPVADAFVRLHKAVLLRKPLALLSFNLTARKPGRDRPETNPYLKKWVAKHGLAPSLQAVFAGKLHYALYRWWEKQIIRLIMKITGGPTNLDAEVDFTNWDALAALAVQIAVQKEAKEDQAA